MMNFFDLSFLQGFVGNLFATVIGVVVGIPVAFWINKRVETITEKEKKHKILLALKSELEFNENILSKWRKNREESPSKHMYGALLGDEVWNTFSDGGELQWIKDAGFLATLAFAYGNIKRIRYLYDSYLHWESLAGTPGEIIDHDLWRFITDAEANIRSALRLIEKD
jgi:hypothetical protein